MIPLYCVGIVIRNVGRIVFTFRTIGKYNSKKCLAIKTCICTDMENKLCSPQTLNERYFKPASEINSTASCSVWGFGFLCWLKWQLIYLLGGSHHIILTHRLCLCKSMKPQLYSCRHIISAALRSIKLLLRFMLCVASVFSIDAEQKYTLSRIFAVRFY